MTDIAVVSKRAVRRWHQGHPWIYRSDVEGRPDLPAGVVDVHDLHVWTLGSGSHALAAHVVLNDRRLSEASVILHDIDTAVRDDFGVDHVTVQFECDTCAPGETIICTQSTAR